MEPNNASRTIAGPFSLDVAVEVFKRLPLGVAFGINKSVRERMAERALAHFRNEIPAGYFASLEGGGEPYIRIVAFKQLLRRFCPQGADTLCNITVFANDIADRNFEKLFEQVLVHTRLRPETPLNTLAEKRVWAQKNLQNLSFGGFNLKDLQIIPPEISLNAQCLNVCPEMSCFDRLASMSLYQLTLVSNRRRIPQELLKMPNRILIVKMVSPWHFEPEGIEEAVCRRIQIEQAKIKTLSPTLMRKAAVSFHRCFLVGSREVVGTIYKTENDPPTRKLKISFDNCDFESIPIQEEMPEVD